MTTPRYLRFAQALALCSGLATVPACPSSTTLTTDGGAPGTDTPMLADARPSIDAPPGIDATPGIDASATDATPGVDASADDATTAADATADDATMLADAGDLDGGDICATCQCWGPLPVDAGDVDGGLPDCFTVAGADICCAVIGPLSPPNLPA